MTLTEQDGSILADAVVAAQNPGLNPAYLAQAIERELPVAQAGLRPRAPHGNLRYRGERFSLKIARAAATLDDFIEKYKICACNLAKSVILFFLAF